MGFTTTTNDNLIKGEVHFSEGEAFTVVTATTYKAGTILARSSSTGKLIPFVKGGSTNGNDVAKLVLPEEVVATATGDVTINAIKTAVYPGLDAGLLVIQADGDATNVDKAVLDGLRDYGIIASTFANITELQASS